MNHGALLTRKNSTGIWLQTSYPSGCIIPFLNISFISRGNFLHLFQHEAQRKLLVRHILVSASQAWESTRSKGQTKNLGDHAPRAVQSKL